MAVCAATRDTVTRVSAGVLPPLVLTKLQALSQGATGERQRARDHAAARGVKVAAMDKRVRVRSARSLTQ